MLDNYQKRFLNQVNDSKILILVEGKNDRKALKGVGLENIIEISGKHLEKVADILEQRGEKVAILTDYDKEGIRQYKRLKNLLIPTGIKIDDNIRRNFKRTFLVNRIEETPI